LPAPVAADRDRPGRGRLGRFRVRVRLAVLGNAVRRRRRPGLPRPVHRLRSARAGKREERLMPKLLVKPQRQWGCATRVTPRSAGWTYVGFELHRLKPGETVSAETGDREACLVWISGRGKAAAGGEAFGSLGGRGSPFDGVPAALYVPAGSDWSVTAESELELAVCTAPGKKAARPPRVIRAADLSKETRGKGTNTRYVTNILPEDQPADSLLVVEVITPGGHTSSYPPHKHDRDDLPRESLLEEVYYHRLKPRQGFAFQRVYTDDR